MLMGCLIMTLMSPNHPHYNDRADINDATRDALPQDSNKSYTSMDSLKLYLISDL